MLSIDLIAGRNLRCIVASHLCDPLPDYVETRQFAVDGAKDGISDSCTSGVETLTSVPFVSAGCDTIEMSKPFCARVSAAVETRRRACTGSVVVSPLIHGDISVGKVVQTSSRLG